MSAPDGPVEIALRIDRLVVTTPHALDAFALQRALGDAVRAVISERGVPAVAAGDVGSVTVDGFAWDGRGAEPGLARALAEHLYDGPLSGGST